MDPQKITYFGETDARGKKIKFGIKAKDRLKHMYIIGKTGMGKSTLLENLAIQDIQNGEGLAFVDPHGGTAEKLLEYVPEHRVKDVLYFAPFDMEYPISFNVMEDIGADKRHLVVNGLMSTFEKIWVDAWSARMAYILNNTLLALLEYPGSTLLGVNKMLSDKEYRKRVVENIKDTSVKAFWVDEFGKWTEKFIAEAIPAIQNKVGQFTSNPLVRNLLGQPQSSFDIRKMMDEKKILIVNLSKGRVGEGNANLIGSMLITKIYLAAMSRADASEADLNKLPNFYLYVDEFQSFANKSFADILSEARKYKLNLTIAHQYIEQMEEEVRDAVFGNVGTMVTFRVGAFDAEVLEKEFAPVFTAEDLVNLGFTQIYLKLMIDGVSSQPFSATTMAPIARPEVSFKEDVINASRQQFANPRMEVEEKILKFHEENRVESGGQKMQERGRSDNRPNDRQEFRGERRDERPNDRMNDRGSGGADRSHDRPMDRPFESRETPRPFEKKFDTPKPIYTEVPPLGVEQKPENPNEDQNKMAFLKVAEELRQKELLKNPSPEKEVSTPALETPSLPALASTTSLPVVKAETRPEPDPKPVGGNMPSTSAPVVPKVSLQDLKPNHEKAKVPTQENISSLKSALSSVLAKAAVGQSKAPVVPIAPVRPEPVSAPLVAKVVTKEPVEAPKQEPERVQPVVETQKPAPEVKVPEPPQQKEAVVEQEKPKEYGTVSQAPYVKEVPEDVLRTLLKME
ncbi:MAG: type IV secretion system DNA-binding domain-containing protein [Candidatus Zambryskibacteria bacterium]|nr:type IV secretion system DNA-binding domain-containing protein [Candidatus Zambryskibacteria bacterium]